MCNGKKPSCGVHSLLRLHYPVAVGPNIRGFDMYGSGCHACDALADEFGRPSAVYVHTTWNGYEPRAVDIPALTTEAGHSHA